jgi:hypothetical protein
LVRGDGVTDYEERIASNIAEHGWFCVSVLGDATRPPFSYSVGFAETLNAPEFIVLGMSGKMGHGMLWELFRALKSGAPAPGDGDRVAGILSGYDCIARKVHPDNVVRDYFNSAIWRWGDPTLRGAPLQAVNSSGRASTAYSLGSLDVSRRCARFSRCSSNRHAPRVWRPGFASC